MPRAQKHILKSYFSKEMIGVTLKKQFKNFICSAATEMHLNLKPLSSIWN